MTYTDDFIANTPGFMSDHALLTPAQIPAGNGSFQWGEQGAHAAVLQVACTAVSKD